MKRRAKTRLRLWAFVETVIRCTGRSERRSQLGRSLQLPPGRPGRGLRATLLFQGREQGPQVSNPFDPWGVQALEINLDFILVFEGFGVFTFGEHGLILFFPLKSKALPQADEKAFCTSAPSKQHCDELRANKSGSDEFHFPFKTQSGTD